MIEIEGNIFDKSISILIDLDSNLTYVSPNLVKACNMKKNEFKQLWLVPLGTCTKRKVTIFIPNYVFFTNDLVTKAYLNYLPLGSYDLLIGMDWLEKQRVILIFLVKTFSFIDEQGISRIFKGVRIL